jgi:signal peptidase I
MDFALIMFVALLATGIIWAADHLIWAPARERTATALQKAGKPIADVSKVRREPLIVEYARAFFPVILFVFLLRSFLVEPFRIPSGSMMPGLVAGDFILVNKYTYGLRLPVINRKVLEINSPKRGDVMVFRYPRDPSVNYIKRVIGLPGDHIVYRDKKLFVNNQPMPLTPVGDYSYTESGDHMIFARILKEQIDGVEHNILHSEGQNPGVLEFNVPEGHYFMMGDNRDRSNDSRYWGTVPEENVVGRAFLIWFSWDYQKDGLVSILGLGKGGVSWTRIGSSIQ